MELVVADGRTRHPGRSLFGFPATAVASLLAPVLFCAPSRGAV